MRFYHLMAALLLACCFALTACGDAPAAETTDDTAVAAPHGEGPEYTSAYVCPMHCTGSGSADPGECPVCGMAYVAQAAHTEDEHAH